MKRIICTTIFSIIIFGCAGANRLEINRNSIKSPGLIGVLRQGIGPCSGGYQQYITLANAESGKKVRIQVKDVMTSAEDNFFSAKLSHGKYFIESFQYGCANEISFVPAIKAKNKSAFESIMREAEKNNENLLKTGNFPKYAITIPKEKPCAIPLLDYRSIHLHISMNRQLFDEMFKKNNKGIDPSEIENCVIE